MMKSFITLLFLFCLAGVTEAADLSAKEIVQKANDIMTQPQIKAEAELEITTTSGKKRVFVYDSFSKNKGEKTLLRYKSPGRVKGDAILMLNNADDIWAYFSRTKRVRKLAAHAKKQKMQGSDFSYEDMGSGDSWITDFNHKLLADEELNGKAVYKIEMLKKENSSSAYSKIILWINKDDYTIVQADYYDEDNPELVLKRLFLKDYQIIQGVPTPMTMIMKNMQDNSESVTKYNSIEYEVDLKDNMFTERGLRQ